MFYLTCHIIMTIRGLPYVKISLKFWHWILSYEICHILRSCHFLKKLMVLIIVSFFLVRVGMQLWVWCDIRLCCLLLLSILCVTSSCALRLIWNNLLVIVIIECNIRVTERRRSSEHVFECLKSIFFSKFRKLFLIIFNK